MRLFKIRWPLVAYDLAVFAAVHLLLLFLYDSSDNLSMHKRFILASITLVCVFGARLIGKIYKQIWRYGGIQGYIRLILVDFIAFLVNMLLVFTLPIARVTFARMVAIACTNILGALAIRMFYRYAYTCASSPTFFGNVCNINNGLKCQESGFFNPSKLISIKT